MPYIRTILAFTLLVCFSTSAWADSQEDNIHCLVISIYTMAALAKSPDPTIQKVIFGGPMYFLGRLDGSGKNWEDRMAAEVKDLTPAALEADRKRCSALLSERGQAFKDLGSRIRLENPN